MTSMNRTPERGSHHADTSFIEGTPSGRIMTSEALRIQTANETLQQEYPNYGKDGKVLTLAISRGDTAIKLLLLVQKGVRLLFSKLMEGQSMKRYQKQI